MGKNGLAALLESTLHILIIEFDCRCKQHSRSQTHHSAAAPNAHKSEQFQYGKKKKIK